MFKYFLGELVKKTKSNGNSSSSSSSINSDAGSAKVEKTKDVEFDEAVRDLKISWIGKSVVTAKLHKFMKFNFCCMVGVPRELPKNLWVFWG